MSGAVSYHAGLQAEAAVARHYERRGSVVAARRWRGMGGEVDLILRQGAEVIFVEVKKSASHARAALALSQRQIQQLCQTAEEFLDGEPARGLTPMRFDLAMVDAQGRIEVLENAFGA